MNHSFQCFTQQNYTRNEQGNQDEKSREKQTGGDVIQLEREQETRIKDFGSDTNRSC